VLEDSDGQVIRPAILWNDQRSGPQTNGLRERADDRILEIGFNRANPTWTLPQMLWLKEVEPEAFRRVHRLYLAKDWLRSRFTGGFQTDLIDAVGTLMVDARAGEWSAELCGLIGWPMASLPPIVQPKSRVGAVTADAARATGLAEGTPVICGTSDTAVETYGAGMMRPGIGVAKLATAATVSVLSPHAVPHKEMINYPHVIPDHWYAITATNSCASAHKWLRDTFFRRDGEDGSAVFDQMERLANAVPPGSEGLFFHPYLNGERSPYWDPLLRADFVGIGFNHGPGPLRARPLRGRLVFAARLPGGAARKRARLHDGAAHGRRREECALAPDPGRCPRRDCGVAGRRGCKLRGRTPRRRRNREPSRTRRQPRRAIRVVATHEPNPERAALYGRGLTSIARSRRHSRP
jgi:xylulokinase